MMEGRDDVIHIDPTNVQPDHVVWLVRLLKQGLTFYDKETPFEVPDRTQLKTPNAKKLLC